QLDLPVKYLKILRVLIARYLKNGEVWAYGSRVKQQNHEASDLDLVVLHDESVHFDVYDFREALRESDIPILIDVMDWNTIPDSFKREINRCHVVVYPESNGS
ncbi:MAG: nucleotidyltransferase domain-containing protein, partial [Thiotrichaceae bacterium]|nr:nucleotidyltransferase domain-containing protein [Thiotrichaceae bacterium]